MFWPTMLGYYLLSGTNATSMDLYDRLKRLKTANWLKSLEAMRIARLILKYFSNLTYPHIYTLVHYQ